GGGGAALAQDRQEDVLGGDVFVLEAVGLFVGQVDNALYARGDKDLPGAAPKDVGLGAGAQDIIQALGEDAGVHLQVLEDLRDHALRLFDQRQQDMLGIDLVMAIALDDLCGALGGFLGSLGKTVKSHHKRQILS